MTRLFEVHCQVRPKHFLTIRISVLEEALKKYKIKQQNVSYHITGKPDNYGFIRREWYFQGERPDYYREALLTNAEAYALHKKGVDHLLGYIIKKPRISVKMDSG